MSGWELSWSSKHGRKPGRRTSKGRWMKKDTFSVIIVPHDVDKTHTYRISYRLFYALLAILGIGVVVIIMFVLTYGRLLIKARESVMLERKVEKLVHKNSKMDEILREMAQIKSMDRKIRGMLGVKVEQDSSRGPERSPGYTAGSRETADQQARLLKATPSSWPVRGYITRGFEIGPSKDSNEYHSGVDIAVERGTPVRAAASGYVVEAGWDDVFGYRVIIDHGFGMKTLYGHNQRLVVLKNETVSRGQTIAYSGSSGSSSAPHLHFEVIRNNIPVDPLDYLNR